MERLAESHEADLAVLRASIVEAVNCFAGGSMSAEELLDSLRGLGLQVLPLRVSQRLQNLAHRNATHHAQVSLQRRCPARAAGDHVSSSQSG